MSEPADLTEQEISGAVEFRGKFLEMHLDTVRLPDGGIATREYLTHPGAVAILALLDNGELLLERQYRYPVRETVIEIPAGKIDPGEAHLLTAQRELLEETGYQAAEWTHLTTSLPCVGYATERIEYYLAQNLSFVGAQLDAGEFLEVFSLPVAEAIEWVLAGKITDSKTIVGLFWLEKWLAKKTAA